MTTYQNSVARAMMLSLSFFCFVLHSSAQAAAPLPNSLLWRISGNGLKKNSFLYGTVHLQDKRVFKFGDSLYAYLEQAEGFAMEVDLQEIMDSMVQKGIDERQASYVDERRLESKDRKKIIDSLVLNVKTNKDKASKLKLEQIRSKKVRAIMKNREMPTIMDAFLYGIAKRKGKWVGGIEDVGDQLYAVDEMGKEITAVELLIPDALMASSLEKMIQLYIANDITNIERNSSGSGSRDGGQNELMNRRNSKMSRRMDSLLAIRTMFFAVGSAHLAGELGVINQLKKLGYQLDPVYSPSSIDAIQYAEALKDIPWELIKDEQNTFSIEMPGKASTLTVASAHMNMKFATDVFTLTYYIAGSSPVPAGVSLATVRENVLKNKSWEIISSRTIQVKNIDALELLANVNGVYLKIRYLLKDDMIYMMMVGSENQENLSGKGVGKFFDSFSGTRVKTPGKSITTWEKFDFPQHGFSVRMPAQPKRNTQMESLNKDSTLRSTVYDFSDPSSSVYFMVQVRDVAPFFLWPNDTAYFSLVETQMQDVIEKNIINDTFSVQGYPGIKLGGTANDGAMIYKTVVVKRGNRAYLLFAGGTNDTAVISKLDFFLNSLVITPYKQKEWQRKTLPGVNFSASVPAELLEKIEPDSHETIGSVTLPATKTYYSYDENQSANFEIFKTYISPYYWPESDTEFYRSTIANYIGETDSVISRTPIMNGGLKGIEWVIGIPETHNQRKIRQVLNGDTIYTMFSILSRQEINSENNNKFFTDFRVKNEDTSSTVFLSKSPLIFKDVHSKDSTIFAHAVEQLGENRFRKEDIPVLQNLLINELPDDSLHEFSNARSAIVNILVDLKDSVTLSFIDQQLQTISGNQERYKIHLLNILAAIKTEKSYGIFKKRLLENTPAEDDNIALSYRLNDSLQLTASLFPELLQLIPNPLYADRIINVSRVLLDSQLLDIKTLLPYKESLYKIADSVLKGMSTDKEYGYLALDNQGLISIIKRFNDDRGNKLIRRFLVREEIYLKFDAALALLHNKQVVPPIELEKIAKSKYYRRELLDSLTEIGLRKLYPLKYLTQVQMAEADMFNTAYDEDAGDLEIFPIGQRIYLFKGVKKRFFLYRIEYSYENDEGKDVVDKYLGIAGAFSLNPADVQRDIDGGGIYQKDKFEPAKVDAQFKRTIELLQEQE